MAAVVGLGGRVMAVGSGTTSISATSAAVNARRAPDRIRVLQFTGEDYGPGDTSESRAVITN
ncbi:MAG: hypothetical protein OXO56_15430 [Gammaproteobacteria bacterium]|nr:hypothetical protein [Gammaproteobacteria bacterium]